MFPVPGLWPRQSCRLASAQNYIEAPATAKPVVRILGSDSAPRPLFMKLKNLIFYSHGNDFMIRKRQICSVLPFWSYFCKGHRIGCMTFGMEAPRNRPGSRSPFDWLRTTSIRQEMLTFLRPSKWFLCEGK